jgi:UDP-3-O-[3-hydroxymyristoyl] glucosamine N-acyltransferase
LTALAGVLGGEAHGEAALPLLRPVPADQGDPQGVAFAESERYLRLAEASGVGALVVARGTATRCPRVEVDDPRRAFLVLLTLAERSEAPAAGVHPSAFVHPGARIADGSSIGPFATVGEGSVVHSGAYVGPGCHIGPRCVVGEGTWLLANAVLVQDVRTGARCRILPGAVVGAEGFGFAWDGSRHVRIPQVGGVVLGDDVEVGANACIDRATCGDTVVGSGTKIDNLVQVGHNARIGRHVVLAGQSGLAGSVTLGDGVVAGGQSAFADHVTVAAGSSIAGRSGVTRSIDEPGEYAGYRSRPIREALRDEALVRRLAELVERVRVLEATLAGQDG